MAVQKGTLLNIKYTAEQIKPDWWVSVCKVLAKFGWTSPLWFCYDHKAIFKRCTEGIISIDRFWEIEFESQTDDELQGSMHYYIEKEDYEKCAQIRDELAKRK